MLPGDDLDALAVAREQLHYALIAGPGRMTLELRLQVGLLAAQVALAERLPEAKRRNLWDEDEAFVWTVEAVEKFLDACATSAVQMIRCLADEGGAATPNRLKELTGAKSLAGITNSLRRASSDLRLRHFPCPTLVEVRHTKPPRRVVAEYRLAKGTLPLVVEAFERIDASRDPLSQWGVPPAPGGATQSTCLSGLRGRVARIGDSPDRSPPGARCRDRGLFRPGHQVVEVVVDRCYHGSRLPSHRLLAKLQSVPRQAAAGVQSADAPLCACVRVSERPMSASAPTIPPWTSPGSSHRPSARSSQR